MFSSKIRQRSMKSFSNAKTWHKYMQFTKYRMIKIECLLQCFYSFSISEPRHDKTNKMTVRPAKTQISLGICPVWSESSLSAWRKLGSLATHWAHSKDADQTGRMPRLIWVFAGRTLILLVLSCHGSSQQDTAEKFFYTLHVNARSILQCQIL